MNANDLERDLRAHYRAMDVETSGRAPALVAAALDRAPLRRTGPVAKWFRPNRLRAGAFVAIAAVAVLAAALLPLWHTSPAVQSASPSSTAHPDHPTATPRPSVGPTRTPRGLADTSIDDLGMGRNGLIWMSTGETLRVSMDYGATWRVSALPDEAAGHQGSLGAVSVVDVSHAWLLGLIGTNDLAVFRTSDGGSSWQATRLPGKVTNYGLQLQFLDTLVGFAIVTTSLEPGASEVSMVYRTLDGGVTWTLTGSGTPIRDIVTAVDADTLWLASSGNLSAEQRPLLRVSRDAGATWSSVALPGIAPTQSSKLYVLAGLAGGVTFFNPSEGYLAVHDIALTADRTAFSHELTRFYRTLDGGLTWSQIAAIPGQELAAPMFITPAHWLLPQLQEPPVKGVIHFGLQETVDGGRTWMSLPANGVDGPVILEIRTVDGVNLMAMGALDQVSPGGVALLLSADGGQSWHPADYSVTR